MKKIKIGAAACLCAALTGAEAIAANVVSLNGTGYGSLEAAVAAVMQPTDTITLLDDIVYLEPIAFTNKQFTLDGDGKTLAWNFIGMQNQDLMALSFSSNCVVNLKNLTIQTMHAEVAVGYNWTQGGDGSEYKKIGASGKLSNVRIETDGTALQVSGFGSNVEVEDCTFVQEGSYKDGASVYHLVDIEAKFCGRVTVKGGTYTSNGYCFRLHPRGGEIALEDGTFTGAKGALIAHIDGPADGWLGTEMLSIPVGSTAKLAGDFTVYYTGKTYSPAAVALASLLGGTVSNAQWTVYNNGDKTVLAQSELKDAPCFGVNTARALADGTLEVVPGAVAIGATRYPTLEAAVEAAKAGDVLTLLTNLTYSVFSYRPIVVSGKDLTLDGGANTNSITWGAGNAHRGDAAFLIDGGSKVDLKNLRMSSLNTLDVVRYAEKSSGTLENVTVDSKGRDLLVSDGAVTLKDCNFSRTGQYVSGKPDWYYSTIEAGDGGVIDVESGTYKSSTNVVYVLPSGGTVNLKGGTFTTTAKGGAYALVVRQEGVEPTVINVPEDSAASVAGKLGVIFGAGSTTAIQLKGGTYDRDPSQFSQTVDGKEEPQSFIAAGYGAVQEPAGKWTIKLLKIDVDGTKISLDWMKRKNGELPECKTAADYAVYEAFAKSSVNGIPVVRSYLSGVIPGEELKVTDFEVGETEVTVRWNQDPDNDLNLPFAVEGASKLGAGADWTEQKATVKEPGVATVAIGDQTFYRVSVK